MKRLLVLVITAWLVVSTARGEGPDNEYLNIYGLIQEADVLDRSQPTQALAKYLQAQTTLQRFQRTYPDWNAKVINFRLNYLALKVEALSAHAPPAPVSNSVAVAVKEAVAAPQVPPPNESERQFNELKQRLQQVEADRAVLEAKLKEALAAQPAMADTRDLSNALSQAKALERENSLLKVSLAQEKGRTGTPQGASAGTASLQAENALLRKQVADLRAAPAAGPAAPSSSLADAQKQIAALQVDKEMWRQEKAALESRLRQVGSPTNTSTVAGKANEPARIKELEGERNQLQKKLDEAMKELYGRKGKALSARLEDMEGQILALRSRLEVFEARQVPYTAEELALFSKPQPQLATAQPDPRAGKKPTRDLPPGTTALIAEAQKFFSTRQFDKAEQNYLQVLSRDQSNVPTLANLAAIQLQLNRVNDAEKNIQRALQIDPEDGYSLSVLGQVKFRQEKYDEALDALSKAAKLDPQNAQIQNLLGLTLSQKGLRGPAETALRKAIQIDSGYGDAHNNLAVVYMGQQPPLMELARWHYQKARAAGSPPNPFLEKAFEEKKTVSSGH